MCIQNLLFVLTIIIIYSGILWPLEAMPVVLRYVAYVLPQTLACEALRSVIMRGWGLDHPVVVRWDSFFSLQKHFKQFC